MPRSETRDAGERKRRGLYQSKRTSEVRSHSTFQCTQAHPHFPTEGVEQVRRTCEHPPRRVGNGSAARDNRSTAPAGTRSRRGSERRPSRPFSWATPRERPRTSTHILALLLATLVCVPTIARSEPAPPDTGPSNEDTRPLEDFLRAGRTYALETQEARAESDVARADRATLQAGLYPSLEARGTYTRNQYASEATFTPSPGEPPVTVVLFPRDLLEAVFSARVPLIDVSRWLRLGASSANVRAADAREVLTERDVDRRVATAFFRALGARATVEAAERSLELTGELLEVTESQVRAGVAMEVDVARMRSDLADRRQALAEARELERLSLRALQSLTGLTSGVRAPPVHSGISGAQADSEETAEEAIDGTLEDWLSIAPELPAVVAAREAASAARAEVRASWAAFAPTLTATAEQRFTNAPGFVGRDSVWSAGLNLVLPFDVVNLQVARTAQAQARVEETREALVLRDARDELHDAWIRTQTAAERARAAAEQAEASDLTARLVRTRYDAGAAGSFETIDASRDAFIAEAGRIREDTELALARVLLRLTAGLAPDAPPPGADPVRTTRMPAHPERSEAAGELESSTSIVGGTESKGSLTEQSLRRDPLLIPGDPSTPFRPSKPCSPPITCGLHFAQGERELDVRSLMEPVSP